MNFVFANHVASVLASGIDSVIDSIVVADTAAPFMNFPTPGAGGIGVATLTDDRFEPTKIEIVTYTGITPGSGNYTLTGVARGAEGTTALVWPNGTPIYQAITVAGLRDAKLGDIFADSIAVGSTVDGRNVAQDGGRLDELDNLQLAVATYVVTNLTNDRSINADDVTMDKLADVLGTLIEDLRTAGIII